MQAVTFTIIVFGLILLVSSCSGYTMPQSDVSMQNPAAKEDSLNIKLNKVTVEMTPDGFVPDPANIKAGDTVVFHNADTISHWPASALHPTHEELPGFDSLGPVKQGDNYEFTFSQAGNWRYHDHLNPRLRGTVVVTE